MDEDDYYVKDKIFKIREFDIPKIYKKYDSEKSIGAFDKIVQPDPDDLDDISQKTTEYDGKTPNPAIINSDNYMINVKKLMNSNETIKNKHKKILIEQYIKYLNDNPSHLEQYTQQYNTNDVSKIAENIYNEKLGYVTEFYNRQIQEEEEEKKLKKRHIMGGKRKTSKHKTQKIKTVKKRIGGKKKNLKTNKTKHKK